jgi:hypothetical protein
MMLRAFAAAAAVLASPAAAEDVGALLSRTLGADAVEYVWLPDSADPASVTEAVGIAYLEIPGAAGNVDIAVGYYRGGAFVGPVREVYGQSPRDPRFLPERIEITTAMPGPNDPRCCPTQAATWAIDRRTLAATRLR